MAGKSKQGWSVSRPSAACVDIFVGDFRRAKDWKFSVLLTTDRHWDNPHSDWSMQKRHLDEAVERNAPIIDNGDFFCAMQGKYDPRASKSCVRPEHQVDNYLDSLVSTAADFFQPYAAHFAVIGEGNHETSIRKRCETSLIDRLVGALNDRAGTSIQKAGYGSWVRFIFRDTATTAEKMKGNTIVMKRYHGHGGGGPVTKGVIQTNRRAASIDADIIFTGHVHEDWSLVTVREGITQSGCVVHRRQLHVCGASYKDEYGDGTTGWHIETGKPPKPLGALWLNFSYHSRTTAQDKIRQSEIHIDVERAT